MSDYVIFSMTILVLSYKVELFCSHLIDYVIFSMTILVLSYNSILNFRIDFTYNSNNWGVGLPPKEKNEKSWPL